MALPTGARPAREARRSPPCRRHAPSPPSERPGAATGWSPRSPSRRWTRRTAGSAPRWSGRRH